MAALPTFRASPAPAPAGSSAVSAFSGFLARAARRITWIGAAEGGAVGLMLAALVALSLWLARGSVRSAIVAGSALVAVGLAAGVAIALHRRRRMATLIEQRAPHCRNIVVTAAELISPEATSGSPGVSDRGVAPRTFPGVRPEIGALVVREAVRTVSGLNPSSLFPARRALAALGGAAAVWAVSLILVSARPALPARVADVPLESVTIDRIDVEVTRPAYAGRLVVSLRDPARIEALAGSRIRVTVEATAAAVTLETIDGSAPLARDGRTFSGELLAGADGYLSIGPVASDGRAGARRLIGLSVTPDRSPRARITAPGRDLFLADARRTLDVAVEADDDMALASLKLRHTKVSGSGERFTFTEGEAPLAITRAGDRNWTARGALALGALNLETGDVVVYRAVVTDRRPGAPPIESDAFIVEITSPGAVASEGFAVDDELDRNAVSQQMVILKTERLIARRSGLTAEAIREEALGLAAEQRRVRAEFVFMMGGELAQEVTGDETGISELDEHEEAEAGDDILAGRLANRGRVELVRAIRAMSDAASRLTAVELDSALTDERLALDHLQRAFSRTRYILRALTQRERLDLTRRLTGSLAEAGRDVRPVVETAADPRLVALRGALASLASLAGARQLDRDASVRASEIAEAVLRVDPSSEQLQEVSSRLAEAAGAIERGRFEEARASLDEAATGLSAVTRASLARSASSATPADVGRLDGTLTDALRRIGGGR
jgi:hypothetical protein